MKLPLNPFNYRRMIKWSVMLNFPLTQPLLGSLRINDGCNSRCNYCWIWKHPVENTTMDDARHAIDELKRLGLRMIGLTGGEPLYHPQIDQIISCVKSKGMRCSLNTNGLLLKPEMITRVTGAGLDGIVLSLDTLQPEVYKKHRGVPIEPVLRGLEHILDYRKNHPGFKIQINSVVTRWNANELIALAEYFNSRNVAVGFQSVHPTFAAENNQGQDLACGETDFLVLKESIDRLIQMKQSGYRINNEIAYLRALPDILSGKHIPYGFTCFAGFTSIAVDHKLYVRSCWPMPPIGNLHYDDMKKLWFSAKYTKRRRDMAELKCPTCWLRCHTEFFSREKFLSLFT